MQLQGDENDSQQRSPMPAVVLFGSGACARQITANLSDRGITVHRVVGGLSQEEEGTPLSHPPVLAMDLIECNGFPGNFELLLRNGSGFLTLNVPAVVVAEAPLYTPNYDAFGLRPVSKTMDISTLEELLQRPEDQRPLGSSDRVVFACGGKADSHPAVVKRMLDGCYTLQSKTDLVTYFLTGDLKVAADGSESRVQQAKAFGTVFLKFSDDLPTIESIDGDRFEITGTDESVRQPFRMQADWIVVDETVKPHPYLPLLAQRLGIHLDAVGFAQADSVRRMNNATNRRGIFVAGGARGIVSAQELRADADRASLHVMSFLRELETETPARVTIQQGRCARCLTCHRLCPHLAIDIGTRITVVAEACQQCGICMAGCPGQAIEMEDLQLDREIERHLRPPVRLPDGAARPFRIVVFGCARSAGQARELIRLAGRQMPQNVRLIEVPCAGTVAARHLLDAFESGADGVMLCTCHTDNCQSETGNRIARKRAAAAREMLITAGVDDRRLRVTSVAANMGTEMVDMVTEFAADTAALDHR